MAGQHDALHLDQAALEIAALVQPVDTAAALSTLDQWAALIGELLPPASGGAQFLGAANQVLFSELGLRGDLTDYYSPANSCLDQVLLRRRGLPITLSIVYIEVARRLLRPVYGIGLPAHFVCLYNDGLVKVFVDVFDRGNLLTESDCLDLVEALTGRRLEPSPLLFAPVSASQILTRMVNNLCASWQRAGEADKAGQAGLWLKSARSSG
ncbi:MAG: hypothetical protein HY858_01685 [Candidatus Solibacter usitatus]|nr:hypothetical protein [Candidatus Solibacter usitatus]